MAGCRFHEELTDKQGISDRFREEIRWREVRVPAPEREKGEKSPRR